MANIQDLSTIRLAMKVQSALGSPASGAGGFGLEVLPSQGLAASIASIESQMIRRSRMRKRPRHGPKTVTAAYETELSVLSCDEILEGVLGGTWAAEQAFSNTDWGAVTISGTGTIATFASGTLLTDGLFAGQFIKFTNLSVAGNNAIWVPILTLTETVMTFPTGYIIDNTSDAAYTVAIARSLYSATPYTDRYFSVEENWSEVDRSKFGPDMRLNSLSLGIEPNAYTKLGFGFGGRDLELKAVGDSPVFTSPDYDTGPSLILLDGGIFVAGTKRTDLTSLQLGISAPVSSIPTIGTRVGPDVTLGQFAFTGQFQGVVADGTDFDAFDDETDISVLLHCKEKATQRFVSFYFGLLSFAGYASPAGGEGGLIQSIQLYGGEDDRGAGFAPSTMVVSTSDAAA